MLAVDRPLPEATAGRTGDARPEQPGRREEAPPLHLAKRTEATLSERRGAGGGVRSRRPHRPHADPPGGRAACRLPSWGPARPEEGRCSSGSEANGGGRRFRHATTRRGRHGEGAVRAEWRQTSGALSRHGLSGPVSLSPLRRTGPRGSQAWGVPSVQRRAGGAERSAGSAGTESRGRGTGSDGGGGTATAAGTRSERRGPGGGVECDGCSWRPGALGPRGDIAKPSRAAAAPGVCPRHAHEVASVTPPPGSPRSGNRGGLVAATPSRVNDIQRASSLVS